VSEAPMLAVDLFIALCEAGYGASLGKVQRELDRLQDARADARRQREEELRFRQRCYTLISRLKKDGLITVRGGEKGKSVHITPHGLKKVDALRQRAGSVCPPAERYASEEGGKVIIVAFDIPERERRKRGWLREVLRHLGLRMIQKSVWVGKAKIPEEFLKDLADMRVIEFVEIFEVSKTGSLSHIV
jgi:DNA-binding transcriptional regulator PaaX